jgi:hypothetical protein
MKTDAVIFDMDGTLADVSSIRHHLLSDPRRKNFHAFHSESVNVPAHPHVVEAAQRVHADGFAVLIVTARKAMWRNHTAFWLAINNVPSDGMWMRADHDNRPDGQVKTDILARIRRSFNVVHAWDDNPAVLAVWDAHGIPTTRVEGWVHEEVVNASG